MPVVQRGWIVAVGAGPTVVAALARPDVHPDATSIGAALGAVGFGVAEQPGWRGTLLDDITERRSPPTARERSRGAATDAPMAPPMTATTKHRHATSNNAQRITGDVVLQRGQHAGVTGDPLGLVDAELIDSEVQANWRLVGVKLDRPERGQPNRCAARQRRPSRQGGVERAHLGSHVPATNSARDAPANARIANRSQAIT